MVAEAHYAQAMVIMDVEWNWAEAEKEFERAIQLNPTSQYAIHAYSHLLEDLGRSKESLAKSNRLLEIDPLDLVMNAHLGWHYVIVRQPALVSQSGPRAKRKI